MRKLIWATAPWLLLGAIELLETLDLVAGLPPSLDIMLSGISVCVTLSTVLGARIDTIASRAPAIRDTFDHAYQLHEQHCAELYGLATRRRAAVGETTTFPVPALRVVQPSGTVYTSQAASGQHSVVQMADRRAPSPRRRNER